MDTFNANQAQLNNRAERAMEQASQSLRDTQETRQNMQTFMDDYDKVIKQATVKMQMGIKIEQAMGKLPTVNEEPERLA